MCGTWRRFESYGAGGGTREKTLSIVDRIQRVHGLTTMSHLTCVNATLAQIRDVLDEARYVPIPDDWFVALSDVVRSTAAIEQGRYRAVNFAGAAAITAVRNALPGVVPSNTYPTCDGKFVIIGANNDAIFKRMMNAIGRDDLAGVQLKRHVGQARDAVTPGRPDTASKTVLTSAS